MRHKRTLMHIMRRALMILGIVALIGQASLAAEPVKKVILVELFTSQGCDSCPSAERLLGELAAMGYPVDRVVPIAFHVDYFNDPWKDPFSDPLHSRRESRYSAIYDKEHDLKNPNYLYLTPLIMVDGREPMLGCDDASRNHKAKVKIREHLDRALKEEPAISLSTRFGGHSTETRRSLAVTISALSAESVDRDLLIEVAVVEDGVATRVRSGENGGKTYVSRFASRSLVVESRKLRAVKQPMDLAIPVSLHPGADARKTSLAVFVQDDATGKVYQASTVPWVEKAAKGPEKR